MSELSYDPRTLTPVQKAALAEAKAKQAEKQAGGFDLRTLIPVEGGERGEKTLRPYTIYLENGEKLYEQPMASGNLFYPNGDPAGRVTHEGKKNIFDKTAEHKDYVSEEQEQLHALDQLKKSKEQNEALAKELAAIKAEKAALTEQAEEKTEKAEAKAKQEKK